MLTPALVVTGVVLDVKPLLLVEDTWSSDSEDSPAESLRTWCDDTGAEIRTTASAIGPDPGPGLADVLADALAAVVTDRLMGAGASRDTMREAFQRARLEEIRDDATCLTIDGEPHHGLVVSSDGTDVRGVIVGETVVVVVSDVRGMSLLLGPVEAHPPLG